MFQIDEKIFVLEREFEFCFQIDEKIFVLESEFDVLLLFLPQIKLVNHEQHHW